MFALHFHLNISNEDFEIWSCNGFDKPMHPCTNRKRTYSCSANIFPVAKPIIPPPTAANIPSLRPVKAMAGVPKQVATKSAVAIGT